MTGVGEAPGTAGAGEGAVSASTYVPVGVTPRYEAPGAGIDPVAERSWLRRALPLMLAHREIFVTSLVLSFLALVVQVQVPEVLRRAIDTSLVAGQGGLAGYVAWIGVLGVARGVMMYGSRRLLFRTAFAIEYDLRNIIYEHLTRLSFPFFDRVRSGELISRANSDIRALQLYLAFAPSILVQCALAVVAFGQMLLISVPLAVVAMSVMPAVFWAGVQLRRQIFPVSWLIQARLAGVATIVDENVHGVRVVKSFAAEDRQFDSLVRAAGKVRWALAKDAEVRARWTPVLENLPRLGMALVLVYGGWLAIEGRTTVGAVVAFSSYVLMLQVPFRQLGMVVTMGRRAAASAGRIYEILDEAPDIVDRPGAVDLVDCRGDVRFRGVSFSYGDDGSLLSGFDLRLEPGETVALVGASGSGKSTVARLLARFYDVDEGAVLLDGHDVRDLTLASVRAQVAVVPDEPFLFSMSIGDNIAYGRPDAGREEVMAAARVAQAHGFIARLPDGYDTVVGERGYTLSGGQRQRLAIARALLLRPAVLVLDDATSAVDAAVEERIHAGRRRYAPRQATLLVAHRLSTIRMADRVVLLSDGRVVACGSHAELWANEPSYSALLAQCQPSGRAGR